MTSTASTLTGHPIEVFVDALERRLDELVDTPTWSLDDDSLRRLLPRLTRAAARLAELELRVAAQVLDLGRKRRFHTESQRTVVAIEQGGCVVEGCDWPPGRCHAHHPKPWSEGGGTNRDGWLLCPRHHILAHDHRYDLRRLPTGGVRFHRRT